MSRNKDAIERLNQGEFDKPLYILVRHNMPYATKVFDIIVETMGIVDREKGKAAVASEIEDYIQGYEDLDLKEPDDWTNNKDGSLSRLHDDNEMAYDLIPIPSIGNIFDRYITLAGA